MKCKGKNINYKVQSGLGVIIKKETIAEVMK